MSSLGTELIQNCNNNNMFANSFNENSLDTSINVSTHDKFKNKRQNKGSTNIESKYEEYKNKEITIDSRYKTELCKNFICYNKCKYGYRCRFAHGLKDLVLKEKKVKSQAECMSFKEVGLCKYGDNCDLTHSEICLNYDEIFLEKNDLLLSHESLYSLENKLINQNYCSNNTTYCDSHYNSSPSSNSNSNYNSDNLSVKNETKTNIELKDSQYCLYNYYSKYLKNLINKFLNYNKNEDNNSRLPIFQNITNNYNNEIKNSNYKNN